jgi:hypothetical protein
MIRKLVLIVAILAVLVTPRPVMVAAEGTVGTATIIAITGVTTSSV